MDKLILVPVRFQQVLLFLPTGNLDGLSVYGNILVNVRRVRVHSRGRQMTVLPCPVVTYRPVANVHDGAAFAGRVFNLATLTKHYFPRLPRARPAPNALVEAGEEEIVIEVLVAVKPAAETSMDPAPTGDVT